MKCRRVVHTLLGPLALTLAPLLACAATITGTVRDTSGAPLAGAIVRPWTAATEPSPGTRCGNCWPDCARRATTDAAGRFTLGALDDSLHFVLLVHASGFVPKFVPDVFPRRDGVDVTLAPLAGLALSPRRVVTGRVLDPGARPVEGALVRLVGWRSRRGIGSSATVDAQNASVTDETGFFAIALGDSAKPYMKLPPGLPDSTTGWQLVAEARGFAPLAADSVRAGGGAVLQLTRGATLRGRVTSGGRGVAGVPVIARVALGSDPFAARPPSRAPLDVLGGFEPARVRTDAAGDFELPHLPPGVEYVLFVPMAAFARYGGAPLMHVRTPGDDSTSTPLGLAGTAPRRVRGRVLRTDGTPPPPRTALTITRRDDRLGRMFDTVSTLTDSLGRFEYTALPAGVAEIGIFWLDGWRVAGGETGWGGLPCGSIRLAERGDVDVELKLEPGPR